MNVGWHDLILHILAVVSAVPIYVIWFELCGCVIEKEKIGILPAA